jgi:hypothetical protein
VSRASFTAAFKEILSAFGHTNIIRMRHTSEMPIPLSLHDSGAGRLVVSYL